MEDPHYGILTRAPGSAEGNDTGRVATTTLRGVGDAAKGSNELGAPVIDAADLDAATRARIELLDLGCGPGRGLDAAVRRYGVEGVGIDLNRRKVVDAQARGLAVYRADITELDPADFPAVKYINLDNVLEHLPSLDLVEDILERSCRIASQLVAIRHPSFEDEEYLASLGFKQYWTDWPKVHTAHVLLRELAAMANRIGVYRMIVNPIRRAVDSNDPTILPLNAPPNQFRVDRSVGAANTGAYDPTRHDPKPLVTFDRPVYFAFDVILVTGPQLPHLEYPADPEISGRRPRFRWPDPPPTGRLRRRGAAVVR